MASFLQVLPLELRRQIYSELLIAKHEVLPPVADLKAMYPIEINPIKQLHPAILRVSKQTYSEAVNILYEDNHFYFNNTKHLMELEGNLNVTRAFARIKNVTHPGIITPISSYKLALTFTSRFT